MFLVILGLVDIIVGIILGVSGFFDFVGISIIFIIGIIAVLKGIYSVVTALASGFYFDLLGVFDIISGILIYLAYSGIVYGFFVYIGIIMIIKGLYSLVMGFVST